MSGGDVPNGSLLHWADIAVAERWQVLLLGNGLSVNVWPRFGYSRLLDHATSRGRELATLRRVLARFEWVFTTSYDLLVYWAIGHGGSYRPFKDHFQYAGRCQFDPKRADVFQGEIPVYYLHGALHLVVGGMGETWKLRLTSLQTILDQFGQPIEGDPRARPLLVTEGSAREKLRAIESNTYLAHALARLENEAFPTVVFGSRLGDEDDHLVDALSESPRPIAISMLPGGTKRERALAQTDLWGRLDAQTLYFFDATTHPLGGPGPAPLP